MRTLLHIVIGLVVLLVFLVQEQIALDKPGTSAFAAKLDQLSSEGKIDRLVMMAKEENKFLSSGCVDLTLWSRFLSGAFVVLAIIAEVTVFRLARTAKVSPAKSNEKLPDE